MIISGGINKFNIAGLKPLRYHPEITVIDMIPERAIAEGIVVHNAGGIRTVKR